MFVFAHFRTGQESRLPKIFFASALILAMMGGHQSTAASYNCDNLNEQFQIGDTPRALPTLEFLLHLHSCSPAANRRLDPRFVRCFRLCVFMLGRCSRFSLGHVLALLHLTCLTANFATSWRFLRFPLAEFARSRWGICCQSLPLLRTTKNGIQCLKYLGPCQCRGVL